MLEKAREANMTFMIGIKLVNFIETLASRKFTDDEVVADIAYLKEELNKVFQTLSSFDEYASEVRSGKLEWSPPHQSDLFWKQNISKFHEKDMEILK
jgi:V-type H+-transporting ATPase subunit H